MYATFERRWRLQVVSLKGHNLRRILATMRQPVSTLAETVLRLEPVEARIRSLGVESLALFGSVLRGAPDASSDVDLLVRFSSGKKNLDHFFRLADLLEERLGRRVELITTEALSPILGPKILAEAQDVLQAA